jgi:hypothetical protein
MDKFLVSFVHYHPSCVVPSKYFNEAYKTGIIQELLKSTSFAEGDKYL